MLLEDFKPGTRVRYIGSGTVAHYFPSGTKFVAHGGLHHYETGTEGETTGLPFTGFKTLIKVRFPDGYLSDVDARELEAVGDGD
jgi:hypothetical protein